MEIDFFTEILRTLSNKYNDAKNALHAITCSDGREDCNQVEERK